MQIISLHTEIECFDDSNDLQIAEQNLLQHASEAKDAAYAPYSRFLVGAALLLEDGTIVKGNNQENAAYPSGLCAERVAIFAAGANFPGKLIKKIAITAASMDFPSDHPVAPCGACRQTMLEYELNQKEPIILIMKGTTGKTYRSSSVGQLLPLFFHEDGLKSK
jgi:cytidine deaminase